MITPLVKDIAASLVKDTDPSASASASAADTPTIIDDPWGSSSWRWGRWILFVIFVAFVLVLIVATARANRSRYVRGQAPIRGTAWLTPPSYRQSEREYVGASQQHVQDFVPQYTETANENDLGYYDERGEFHSNDKTAYVPPPALDAADSPALQRPQPAVTRPPQVDADDAMDFSRPVFRADATDTTHTFPGYFGTPASGSSRERSHSRGSSSNINKMDTVEETRELK